MRITLGPTPITAMMLGSALALSAVQARTAQASCADLPDHAALRGALIDAVEDNRAGLPPGDEPVGLGNEMWATIVDRDGIVCAVAFTGEFLGDQWPGSRVISAQKANTANAFSLPAGVGFGAPLSSGNLYGTVLEQGSLFGLQFSNPVDTGVAYGGPNHPGGSAENYGQPNDPMVGQFIGGVNVFGGGLALYDEGGFLVGGLGVSGDTSCTDHIIAWLVRDDLDLDNIPGGVANGTDNLIIPTDDDGDPVPVTPNTFEHPTCGFGEDTVIAALPGNFPVGGDDGDG